MKKRKTTAQKRTAATSSQRFSASLPFHLIPRGDEAIRFLTRSVLSEAICPTCGLRHREAPLPAAPAARRLPMLPQLPSYRTAPLRIGVAFDSSRYLDAFASSPSPRLQLDAVDLSVLPTEVSAHLLTLSGTAIPDAAPRQARRPLFRPAGLPELRSLTPYEGLERSVPAAEERLKLQAAIPGGLAGVGRQAAAGTFAALDAASAGIRAAAAAAPGLVGVADEHDLILPAPESARPPATLGWASGVPKNLPVETETARSEERGERREQVTRVKLAVRPRAPEESFLDRWERAHDTLLDALRAPSGPWRAAASFALVAGLFVVAPVGAVGLASRSGDVRSAVVDAGKQGVAALVAAGKAVAAKDPAAAADSFGAAAASFAAARATFHDAVGPLRNVAAALPVVGADIRAADALLTAADSLARAGETVTAAMTGAGGGLLPSLAAASVAVRVSRADIANADDALRGLDPESLPPEYRDLVRILAKDVAAARLAADAFPERADALAEILGRDGRRRYLVVFQNANELRATGGFLGSIAEVTVDRGAVADLRVPEGGSYDLQGDLRAELLPPSPLLAVTGRWQFHDANWFPDFPTTAKKLSWFYQKGGGPSVDGIVAVTSDILPTILGVTGPIAMPAYRRTITADNVIRETQQIVEVEHDADDTKPKRFIGELLGEVMRRLQALPPEKLTAAGEAIAAALAEKTVQLAFFDDRLETLADDAGWTGRLARSDADSLMVVDSNVGGGKTDGVVAKRTEVEARIAPDGSVTDTVTLTYEHRGIPTDRFTGETYRDYLRLYVPAGSELVAATGDFRRPPPSSFETPDPSFGIDPSLADGEAAATKAAAGTDAWTENGRAVFGNWISLSPGEKAVVRFVYRSGATVRRTGAFVAAASGADVSSYRLRLERQAGAKREATVTISPPAGAEVAWLSSALIADDGTPTPLVGDRFYAAAFVTK